MKAFDDTPGSLAPIKPGKDWAWLEFSNTIAHRMEPQGDGTYELVVIVSLASSDNRTKQC